METKYSFSLILFFILFSACSKEISEKELIGTYKTSVITKTEKIYYRLTEKTKKWIVNNELELKPNKTFTYEMCGAFSEGKWGIEGNRLLLKIEKSSFKNDSLSRIKTPDFESRSGLLSFKIKKDYLVGIVENSDESKSLNKLTKVAKSN